MTLKAALRRTILDADPDNVIVSLYQDDDRIIRGDYTLPPKIGEGFAIERGFGEKGLLAPIAIIRAHEAARLRGIGLCIVDPAFLWQHFDSWQHFTSGRHSGLAA